MLKETETNDPRVAAIKRSSSPTKKQYLNCGWLKVASLQPKMGED
jgi:hypothetical protein